MIQDRKSTVDYFRFTDLKSNCPNLKPAYVKSPGRTIPFEHDLEVSIFQSFFLFIDPVKQEKILSFVLHHMKLWFQKFKERWLQCLKFNGHLPFARTVKEFEKLFHLFNGTFRLITYTF
jgi:hypothetical protein